MTRAASIAAHLGAGRVTGLSSHPRPGGWGGEWIELDDDGDDGAAAEPTAGGALHWAPLRHPGLRERMGRIAAWVRDAAPALVVVDVSVEVTVLVRTMGVPVVVMGMPGDRRDAAHQLAYRLADAVLAPWPDWAEPLAGGAVWRAKTHAVGAVSRFDGRARDTPRPALGGRRRVLVLSGRGGTELTAGALAAAEAATPDWAWTVLGPPGDRWIAGPVAVAVRRRRRGHARRAERDRRGRGGAPPGRGRRAGAAARRAARDRGRAPAGRAGRGPARLACGTATGRACSRRPRAATASDGHGGTTGPARRGRPPCSNAGRPPRRSRAHRGDHAGGRAPRAPPAQHAALRRQEPAAARHVVVAMGCGEARRCRAACGETAEVVAVERPAAGLPLARARNAGAERALAGGAELLVFLDVDCLPGGGLLDRYRAAAGRAGPALLCGPVAYLPPEPRGGYPATGLRALAAPHPGRPAPPDGVLQRGGDHALFWSLSFAVTSATWRRIGGFSEVYVGYGGEDTDFGQLARRAGADLCWVGGALAFHQHHPVSSPPVQHLDDILRNAADLPRPVGMVAHVGLAVGVRRARSRPLRRGRGRLATRRGTRRHLSGTRGEQGDGGEEYPRARPRLLPMRVLFTTTGSAGHLGPLVPFADAVRRAGGDVLVATRGSSAQQARAAGFAVWAFADAPAELRSAALAEVRDLPLDVAHPRLVTEVFGGMDARAALPDVLDACASWRPTWWSRSRASSPARWQPGISTFPRSPSRSRSSPSSTGCAGRWTMRCAGCAATTRSPGRTGPAPRTSR